ncbi:MAG: hypothetical protein V1831_04205 [Candidatus Woesearchaeota archaeon]
MTNLGDLVILNKFPRKSHSKTRLGRQLDNIALEIDEQEEEDKPRFNGYEESAKLAQLLLDDVVNAALPVCDVTIACPNYDADDLKKEYPNLSIYGGSESLIARPLKWVKDTHTKKKLEKVVIMTGDVVVKTQEVESWFNHLDKYKFLFGPTIGGMFYNNYMIGFNKEIVKYFAAEESNFKNFPYGRVIGWSRIAYLISYLTGEFAYNKLKFWEKNRWEDLREKSIKRLQEKILGKNIKTLPGKIDIDTINDLYDVLNSGDMLPGKTRDHAQKLMDYVKKNTKPGFFNFIDRMTYR